MNNNEYQKIVKKFKLKRKTKKILLEQIDLFYSYKINNICEDKKEVLLNNNSLIHGTRANINELKIISELGLISSEFYSNLNEGKKKPYVVELWKITENIKLQDWIKKYTGITICFKNNHGVVYKSMIVPFDKIEETIKQEQDFRDYIIYQNQEQRFVPNDTIDNASTVAFIVQYNSDDKLIKNDIFDEKFDYKTLKDLLPKWFYKKYMVNRSFDNYETGREKAILFGIPLDMIKGIMVSRKIEKEENTLEEIKKLFPNCYICNIDGVIMKI